MRYTCNKLALNQYCHGCKFMHGYAHSFIKHARLSRNAIHVLCSWKTNSDFPKLEKSAVCL
jgi:hypothetical protein